MRRGSQIDSAVFRQVLPNSGLLDAVEDVEDDMDREAVIASRVVKAYSERAESRKAAKILYRRWLDIIKEAELPWDFRRKAESFWDLISTDGLREKWLVDEFYDNPGVSTFWYDNSEDDEQDRLREMLEEDVNELLLRTKVIGSRAKGKVSSEGDYSVINDKAIITIVARKFGFKVEMPLMRSTEGDSWSLSNEKEFLDLDITFDKKGRLSVYAFAQEEFQQEPLAEVENVKLEGNVPYDMKRLLAAVKKVISKAKQDDLLEHLKFESML